MTEIMSDKGEYAYVANLEAEVEERDRRIVALEYQLEQVQKRADYLADCMTQRDDEVERLQADYDAAYKNYVTQRDEVERLAEQHRYCGHRSTR